MRVTSIDVLLIPQEKPTFPRSCPVLCRVNTDEGIYGYGEAGTTFAVGFDAVFAMIKELSPMVIGMSPMDTEVIWQKIYQSAYWTRGNGAIIMAALSALDTALWDIKGKALGKPIYELLGGKFRDRLRCYASQLQFGFSDTMQPQYTYQQYYDVAQVAVEKGYDAVKVDPMTYGPAPGAPKLVEGETYGRFSAKTVKTIVQRMQATREAVGNDVDIIMEMHCSTDLQSAIQVAKACESFNLMYLEEPVDPLVPQTTKQLALSTSIPLTTGERTYLRAGFLPFLQDRSLAMIQPDIGICGGITECKKIADMAYTYNVGVQAHVCGTPISVAAGVHLEAAIANFTIHETHVMSLMPRLMDLGVYDDFVPVSGYITVPHRPGLGQELSEKALRLAVKDTVK